MLQNLKVKIANAIWHRIKDYFYGHRIADIPLIQNINYSATKAQQKAIICYLTASYLSDWENNNIGRTQPKEILSMVHVLTNANYVVDIIGCHDVKSLEFLQAKKYDLILGFGEAFYQLTELHSGATSILYMTEHHPDFTRVAEQKRLDYFYVRHKILAKTVRTGNFYKDHHMKKKYSYVLTMSEIYPFKQKYSKPFPIFPTGLRNTRHIFGRKDYCTARKHFLWFGSYGAIHKGLDLLLDIFSQREDIVLHIGGFYKDDRKILLLPKKGNIIDYGYIDVMSDTFLEVVNKCGYTLLPSCSEGCSTSITTGMRHGLIPVVMKSAGFDRLGDHAMFLEDYRLEYLEKRLTEISQYNPERLKKLSAKVFDFANTNFSNKEFEKRFENIMREIL